MPDPPGAPDAPAPGPPADDPARWAIDELAAAYLAALRRRRAGIDPAIGRLQAEWGRRPADERRAALQRYRAKVAGPGRPVPLLGGPAGEARR